MDSFLFGERLVRNRVAIIRDLEPSKYWNYLYQEGIFDQDDMDEVKAEKTRKKKAEALLEKVEHSGPGGIAVFVNTLSQKQPHLFELLQREPESIGRIQMQAVSNQLPTINQVIHHVTDLHIHGEPRPFVRKALNPVEHGQGGNGKALDQHSSPVEQTTSEAGNVISQSVELHDEAPPFIVTPTDLSKLPAHIHPHSEEVYPMTARPRGIALIINIEYFFPSSELTQKEREIEKLDSRQGSEKDVKSLERLFGALDFKVIVKRNVTEEELLKALKDVSCKDHSAYDCFVLCLMSHGKEGQFYCKDGKTVSINKISDFFSNSNCDTLKGKPKLFFIQSCRGNVKERGVVKDAICDLQQPVESQQPSAEDDEDRGWNFSFQYDIIPNHADMLMAYSTVNGYASFRNPLQGSRFVRCVVEVFQERAGYEDVLSMLTKVNDDISKMGEVDCKQVGQPTSTLRKKVFFWPGL